MKKSSLIRAAIAAALCLGVVATAGPASAHEQDGATASADHLTPAQRLLVRQATNDLRTPRAAIAAGYQPTDACVELPGVGGMGYHYVNLTYASDSVIDPVHPEVLVFVPDPQGRLRLSAVEYFKADADQDKSTTDDRPSLWGHQFQGPMDGHEPGMPIHYDFHLWVYKRNPLGQLAPWNPDVHCPSAA